MKTTEIMKIEYSEPVVRVKEVSRRRCVVAQSDTYSNVFTAEGYSNSDGSMVGDETNE